MRSATVMCMEVLPHEKNHKEDLRACGDCFRGSAHSRRLYGHGVAFAGQSFQVFHFGLSRRETMRALVFLSYWFLFAGVTQSYDHHVFWLKTVDFALFVLLVLVSYDELCTDWA